MGAAILPAVLVLAGAAIAVAGVGQLGARTFAVRCVGPRETGGCTITGDARGKVTVPLREVLGTRVDEASRPGRRQTRVEILAEGRRSG